MAGGLGQATRGFLGGTGAGGVTTPILTVGVNTLDLVYSAPVTLTSVGEDLVNWGIAGTTFPVNILTVTQLNSTTIRLTTTNQHTGGAYSLLAPLSAVLDPTSGSLSAAVTIGFTGHGVSPSVVSATPLSGNSVRVRFSEPVVSIEALALANYVVSPSLAVTGVVQEAVDSYVVYVTTMKAGIVYTLAVSNIHDLAGNLVA